MPVDIYSSDDQGTKILSGEAFVGADARSIAWINTDLEGKVVGGVIITKDETLRLSSSAVHAIFRSVNDGINNGLNMESFE